MKASLKSIYHREMFFPTWVGIFINPFYFARAGLYLAIKELAPQLKGRLLDVGCGSKPYRSLFATESYVGLDLDSKKSRLMGVADEFYDGKVFPFPDATFDSVLCNQVLEHVFNPHVFLAEIGRVLKPGGKLLLTAPFVWDEHEQPYDFARYSSFGLRSLLENQGFIYLTYKKLGDDPSCIFQLANAYLNKVTQNFPKPARLTIIIALFAVINLTGLFARLIFPRNPDLFLDHIVLAEKS